MKYALAHYSLFNGEQKLLFIHADSEYDAVINYLELDYNEYPDMVSINEYLDNVEEHLNILEC